MQVLGWSEFNDTTEILPPDRNFLLEVRDKDLHLLYRFADLQNGYFLSSQGPFYGVIEFRHLRWMRSSMSSSMIAEGWP